MALLFSVLLYILYILMVPPFSLITDHFPFVIKSYNLHHYKAKIISITEPFAQE